MLLFWLTTYENVIDIIKIVFPAICVGAVAYIVLATTLNAYLNEKNLSLQEKQIEFKAKKHQDSFALRLQAYERLVLFMERIAPQNLLVRLNQDIATVPEMQMILIANIRAEFEHNITQQIYVSSDVWSAIKLVVEEYITLVNTLARSLPTEASGLELRRRILEFFMQNPSSLPIAETIEQLKVEARELM